MWKSSSDTTYTIGVNDDVRGINGEIGMTQVLEEKESCHPVTLLRSNNVVVPKRTPEKNCNSRLRLSLCDQKKSELQNLYAGQFRRDSPHNNLCGIQGFREESHVGDVLVVRCFNDFDLVDVRYLQGKGLPGVVKRHGFDGGRKTHGSKFHREPGSTGNSSTPGKTHRGIKMPGHMGNERVTVQNLKIVKVDAEKKVLLVRGAVPGPRDGMVIVRRAVKK
jgi:large subunit ribosomal protein L3